METSEHHPCSRIHKSKHQQLTLHLKSKPQGQPPRSYLHLWRLALQALQPAVRAHEERVCRSRQTLAFLVLAQVLHAVHLTSPAGMQTYLSPRIRSRVVLTGVVSQEHRKGSFKEMLFTAPRMCCDSVLAAIWNEHETLTDTEIRSAVFFGETVCNTLSEQDVAEIKIGRRCHL